MLSTTTESWWRSAAARTRWRCGTSCSNSATGPTGCTSGSGSASTATSASTTRRQFADERGLKLQTIDLRGEYGYDVPTAAKVTKRVPCSACGLSKRHLFDKAALDGGYDVVVTGHNLDDEAAVLFGNALRWDIEYLARQHPVLAGSRRVPEEGQAAGAADRARDGRVVHRARHRLPGRGMPDGARQQAPCLQGGAERDRAQSPGSKSAFYLEFVDKMAPLLAGSSQAAAGELRECDTCGAPTTGEACAFCRLQDRVSGTSRYPSRWC